jgi:hypothetical protein
MKAPSDAYLRRPTVTRAHAAPRRRTTGSAPASAPARPAAPAAATRRRSSQNSHHSQTVGPRRLIHRGCGGHY